MKTKLDDKSFNPKKKHGDETHYGKSVFAKSVVRAKADSVDFSGFEELLKRMEAVLNHYAAHSTVPAFTVAVAV
ncbi:MAG: hypothetical protein OXE84_05210 [Rhodobacteraceae bacterium]|nr:hypothetical protein [Paracoccaceae bacterium]MCY4197183.1 hypothetical protein [Paracoccaceae bacterium]MCY4327571.1 hypothetical protein [Paracoccaceae bacterium]